MNKGTYNPYSDERYISSEASFELIDVDAAISAATSGDSGLFFSKPEQTHDKITSMTNRVATLEPNEWVLDGGYTCISENIANNGEVGYWSEVLSDENGNIDITREFTFEIPQDSRAFTVIFDDTTNDCASDFELTAYNSNGDVINTQIVTDNESSVVIVDLAAENYTKIVAHFTKTNKPHRHLRICEVVFGYLKIFNDDEIVSVSLEFDSSIDSQNLPTKKLVLTIDNTDRRYNIISPTGIYKYLQKGQGLNISIFINGERVTMGRFYFESSKSNDNSMTAQITAYDRLYFLDDIECNIGTTGTWTVSQAVEAVITDSKLPITYEIPENIGNRNINKWIPQNTSIREALRLIAQAGMSVCYINRLDVLVFKEPGLGEYTDLLDNDRMSQYPDVSDTGLINSVEITSRNEYEENSEEIKYTASNIQPDEDERLLSINNPLVNSNEVANWILKMAGYRIQYDISERGNPEREIQDIINIYDVYGENKNAVVLTQKFDVDIGLTGTVKAVTNNA